MQPKLKDVFVSVSDCCSMYDGLRVLCCIFGCLFFCVGGGVYIYIFPVNYSVPHHAIRVVLLSSSYSSAAHLAAKEVHSATMMAPKDDNASVSAMSSGTEGGPCDSNGVLFLKIKSCRTCGLRKILCCFRTLVCSLKWVPLTPTNFLIMIFFGW